MIYHKFKIDDRQTAINELYDDELITYCGECGKEMEVTLEDIAQIHEQDCDLAGTVFYCVQCSEKRRETS